MFFPQSYCENHRNRTGKSARIYCCFSSEQRYKILAMNFKRCVKFYLSGRLTADFLFFLKLTILYFVPLSYKYLTIKGGVVMENYQAIDFRVMQENAAKLIGSDWMLITAGNSRSFNTMTASWGGLGHLWNKDVAFIFVRPQRYTLQFIECEEIFTLSFFDRMFRPALQTCGSQSGRDGDKVAQAGLTPIETTGGSVSFAEARMFLECRKLYGEYLKPEAFTDRSILASVYPQSDFHKLYIGEVVHFYFNTASHF